MPESISVIIPAYNSAKTLERCLRSIFSQTRAVEEIVIVDDGSLDDTLRVANNFSDGRINIITQKNAGPGAARNAGIRACRCRLVAFLDADDEWLPEHLEYAIRGLGLFHSDFYSCAYREIPDTPWGNRQPQRMGQEFSLINCIEQATRYRSSVFTSTVVARRSLIEQVGFFREDFRMGEDLHYWFRVALTRETVYGSRANVVYHRESLDSLTHTTPGVFSMMKQRQTFPEISELSPLFECLVAGIQSEGVTTTRKAWARRYLDSRLLLGAKDTILLDDVRSAQYYLNNISRDNFRTEHFLLWISCALPKSARRAMISVKRFMATLRGAILANIKRQVQPVSHPES
jgi:GT2 family glycosyltransferase